MAVPAEAARIRGLRNEAQHALFRIRSAPVRPRQGREVCWATTPGGIRVRRGGSWLDYGG